MGNMMADAYEALRHEQAANAADREPYRTTTYTQRLDALERRVSALEPADVSTPLPAPVLTENLVYEWLRDDPSRLGRILPAFAVGITVHGRIAMAEAAKEAAADFSGPGAAALQSLAVALAAASYQG